MLDFFNKLFSKEESSLKNGEQNIKEECSVEKAQEETKEECSVENTENREQDIKEEYSVEKAQEETKEECSVENTENVEQDIKEECSIENTENIEQDIKEESNVEKAEEECSIEKEEEEIKEEHSVQSEEEKEEEIKEEHSVQSEEEKEEIKEDYVGECKNSFENNFKKGDEKMGKELQDCMEKCKSISRQQDNLCEGINIDNLRECAIEVHEDIIEKIKRDFANAGFINMETEIEDFVTFYTNVVAVLKSGIRRGPVYEQTVKIEGTCGDQSHKVLVQDVYVDAEVRYAIDLEVKDHPEYLIDGTIKEDILTKNLGTILANEELDIDKFDPNKVIASVMVVSDASGHGRNNVFSMEMEIEKPLEGASIENYRFVFKPQIKLVPNCELKDFVKGK